MVIELTAEQEALALKLAVLTGKSAQEIASDVLSHALDERFQFAAAVKRGQDAADRGDFVSSDEVWARVEAILQG